MNSDFPFLYQGDDGDERRRGGWDDDGIHRENDNLSPDQYLQDQVMGAYQMYLNAKGLDPDKHTLHFEIRDEESSLGRIMPVIDQSNIHELIIEFGNHLDKNLSEAIAFAALVPSLRLSIQASKLPQRTKDAAMERLDSIAEVTTGLIDHSMTNLIMIKEMNALINTSAAIENERIKNATRAKGGNNLLSDAQHDGDV